MPFDYLLSLLHDQTLPRPERTFAAVAAGPYLHAKLSAVSLAVALDPERMSTGALEQAVDQAQAKWATQPEWEKMARLRAQIGRVIEAAGQLSRARQENLLLTRRREPEAALQKLKDRVPTLSVMPRTLQ